MQFSIVNFTSINQIIDLVLSIVLICLVIFVSYKLKFNKYAIIFLSISNVALLLSWLFQLDLFFFITLIIILTTVFIICLSHIGSIRAKFQALTKKNVAKKVMPDKIIDHEALYHEIYEAVITCSRQKIGAIITFEKHDNLMPLTKNGTAINAPVTKELIMTIFYPGTRLHDGAVIIKDGKILAASVYYTPTTKALTGKYGSRHRAAIGISEISDSVTVVVSEETGRISFAQDGELESVLPDDFIDSLAERMTRAE